MGVRTPDPLESSPTVRALLITILLALAMASCFTRPVKAQTADAYTFCDRETDNVVVTIGKNVWSSPNYLQEVLTHETVHVAQLARIGDCSLASQHYTSSQLNAAWLEAEAYCASWPYALHRVNDARLIFDEYVRYVLVSSGRFPAGDGTPDSRPLTPYDVTQMFMRLCPQYVPRSLP